MEITKQDVISVAQDSESLDATLSEVYNKIQELKDERDRFKIKALARKVELKRLKESSVSITTDNYELNYRDNRGVLQKLSKSGLGGVRVQLIVTKGI